MLNKVVKQPAIAALLRKLAVRAGVPDPPISWDVTGTQKLKPTHRARFAG